MHRFTINAAKGAKVKVSYLGFEDREVKASENMNIAMSEDTQALSEVVPVSVLALAPDPHYRILQNMHIAKLLV